MSPMEMVVAIVGIGAVASVVKAKYAGGGGCGGGIRRRIERRFHASHGDRSYSFGDSQSDFGGDAESENERLREELRGLKERIQVLERLATDEESDARRLDREIEKLRERPGLSASTHSKE